MLKPFSNAYIPTTRGIHYIQETLVDNHPGCSSSSRNFVESTDCVAAVHRFCTHLKFFGPKPKYVIGVQREVTNEVIGLSCISADFYYGNLYIRNLKLQHSSCDTPSKAASLGCLIASHRWCSSQKGAGYAGIIQEVSRNAVDVGCFKSKKHMVSWHEMRIYSNTCSFLYSAQCFSAASRLCQDSGFAGGIPQDGPSNLMSSPFHSAKVITVACYEDVFSNDVFFRPNRNYIMKRKTATKICDLQYDLKEMVESNPKVEELAIKEYDNRKSGIPFQVDFTVSKKMRVYSKFITSDQTTSSLTFDLSVSASIPLPGAIQLSSSRGLSISFEKTNSETFEEGTDTTREIRKTVTVTVPPGKAVRTKAILTRSIVTLPYTAQAITQLGVAKELHGAWEGVALYNFKVVQEDMGLPNGRKNEGKKPRRGGRNKNKRRRWWGKK